MPMRNIIYLVLLFSGLLFSQSEMTHQDIVLLKSKVKSQSDLTETIVSDFTQYKHLDFLSNDIITSGQLVFKAPDLVKWAYVAPYEYSVIFKNDVLHINDEGRKSELDLSSSKLFKKLNHLIISSVKGDMFNDDQFVIKYMTHENNYKVCFSPLNDNISKYIKEFQILFNVNGEVKEIKMIEPTDDFTKIVFNNRVINKSVTNAVFAN